MKRTVVIVTVNELLETSQMLIGGQEDVLNCFEMSMYSGFL